MVIKCILCLSSALVWQVELSCDLTLSPTVFRLRPNPNFNMPRLSVHTAMLDELTAHHHLIQQQCFQRHISKVLSDLSETDLSDSSHSFGSPFSFGSPISIDTPDIALSSELSAHSESDHGLAASTSSSDSDMSITDFKIGYYKNWQHQYNELVNHINSSQILLQAPPVPKSSQLHLLDHWRLHDPDHFHCKVRVDPKTFDSLVELISDDPIFSNHSNCPQFPVHLQLLEFAGPVGSGFLTKFGPTGPVAVATKSKFLATATATAKNR
jgi:hypothetical protein